MSALVEEEALVTAADPRWREVGVTARMLDYWSVEGILRCDEPRPGSGVSRQYPADEIAVAGRIVRLRRVGFALDAAARIARLGVGIHNLEHEITVVVTR